MGSRDEGEELSKGVSALSHEDLETVRECLRAAVEGPFFEDWEYHTLMGVDRGETAEVLRTWPEAEDGSLQDVVVRNVLNNLLGYPHHLWRRWGEYVSRPPAEVAEILRKWRGESEFDPRGKGYFDRLT